MTTETGARRRRGLIAGVGGILTLAVGALTLPTPPSLGQAAEPETQADERLLSRVEAVLADRPGVLDRLVVAELELSGAGDAEAAWAEFGATRDTEFEIGSVTKTVTASLFADAIDRGEVEPDTRVGELLDLGTAPVADATLEDLVSQRSGLPALPSGPGTILGQLRYMLGGADPYPADPDAAITAARDAELGRPGTVVYSNLGFALLGHALAAAAGTTYPELVRDRFIGALDLGSTRIAVTPEELGDAPTGWTATGRPADPWTLHSYAPAGAIRSTGADLAAWVERLLREEPPGAAALEPRFDAGELGLIGWAWFTTPVGDRQITWHNGITGGFTSIVALDREAGRAVIVLSSTSEPVDDIAFALLADADAADAAADAETDR